MQNSFPTQSCKYISSSSSYLAIFAKALLSALDQYHQLILIVINTGTGTIGHTKSEYNFTPGSHISSVSHSFLFVHRIYPVRTDSFFISYDQSTFLRKILQNFRSIPGQIALLLKKFQSIPGPRSNSRTFQSLWESFHHSQIRAQIQDHHLMQSKFYTCT